MENKRYLINFLILLPLIYLFLKIFEFEISRYLAVIVGLILNAYYFDNIIIYNKTLFSIIPACTCSFEMSLFLAYVFATPKTPMKYKLIYSSFGILVINLINILRIILILKNAHLTNYSLIHDMISFIIFPTVLILNIIWVRILIKVGIVKNIKINLIDK
ncbi:archaeosortase D [Methanocaldococcus fervens]|uniref:Exosortase EpsH-related protein n=1 Tax=Methanocaldococcus fervens (strain DSM 4213 / JCM 15782 / AG86) TaxID=573064 RepID=C7P900_METFA|nr:archaeosortase D [Methanocaldococcus fervens]ACV25032.1 hypothetical protein Mefer_1223 [Methanocaldococcus fervens AG86]